MSVDKIIIRGAREHNLKNVDLELPKNKLIVFTGLSGSGKSSLAFDTLYAEGQRRYVESLSAYARQFLGMMKKPDVDSIEGLSPAISIDQKSVSANPRSTVGTITEIYDYLRLLYARIGHPHCPNCGREISQQSSDQIVKAILKLPDEASRATKQFRLMLLAPVIRGRKGEFIQLFSSLRQKGYTLVRIDGKILSLDDDFVLIKTNKHNIDVVIDRLVIGKKMTNDTLSRLNQSVEAGLKLADGLVIASRVLDADFDFPTRPSKFDDHLYSEKFSCPMCNISIAEIEPRTFSFNSPYGACPGCAGLGSILKIDPELVVNPHLSLSEGGILPFANLFTSDTWFTRTVKEVAKKYHIDWRAPIESIAKDKMKVLLYGLGDQTIRVWGENRFGRETYIETEFSGLVKELERRWQETDSDYVRGEIEKYMRHQTCPVCLGKRLKKEALSITVNDKSIIGVTEMSIKTSFDWIKDLPAKLSEREKQISQLILREINNRLGFLLSVGLDYLTLERATASLAGGEAQRIRLASQIGSGLSGVLYILDEPSIGLHQRDNKRLITTLKKLRNLGNTLVVVEHDREMMENSDWLVDFGPQAGDQGGQVVVQGTPVQVRKSKKSYTAKFLNKTNTIAPNGKKKDNNTKFLEITNCTHNNLKNIDVKIPLGKLVCVTGVSGSGKSSLVDDTLYHALSQKFRPFHQQKPGAHQDILGWEDLHNVILVDQSPIGRTPRSNPATYVGAFNFIRDIFAKTNGARQHGWGPGRFSFNVKGGRCEACRGEGQIKIEMQFLPPIWVDCEVCKGRRYNYETLQVNFKGKNIFQVLEMTISESLKFFANIPPLLKKIQTLEQVGLGYLKLGQPAPTLSGGEAQRVKLGKELSKAGSGNTLYILDEPTTGLHYEDLKKLLNVLRQLVAKGNTVLVIEHNLDIIAAADWIIDLGPEGGQKGGQIVAQGTPLELTRSKASYTGQFLAGMIKS
jgi:excinuclease ABC subunit A